jgi:hypothetical protein
MSIHNIVVFAGDHCGPEVGFPQSSLAKDNLLTATIGCRGGYKGATKLRLWASIQTIDKT